MTHTTSGGGSLAVEIDHNHRQVDVSVDIAFRVVARRSSNVICARQHKTKSKSVRPRERSRRGWGAPLHWRPRAPPKCIYIYLK